MFAPAVGQEQSTTRVPTTPNCSGWVSKGTFHIYVAAAGSQLHRVDVKVSTTVDALCRKIRDKTGVASDKQLLRFDDMYLAHSLTLKDYNIKIASTVFMYEGLTLWVKTSTTSWLKLVKVFTCHTINMVKTRIRERTGIPNNQQVLQYKWEELEDDRTLLSYDMQNDCVLHLVINVD